MKLMKIETFDLLEFENANSHEKKIYTKKIDDHLQKIGFLIIVNHGISKTCLNNIGLVVGATKVDNLSLLKTKTDELPWLMPGVGFQGGNLKKSLEIGECSGKGLSIINVSRGIYALNQKMIIMVQLLV